MKEIKIGGTTVEVKEKKKGVDLDNSKEIERRREEKNVSAEIERAGLGKCHSDRRTQNKMEIEKK